MPCRGPTREEELSIKLREMDSLKGDFPSVKHRVNTESRFLRIVLRDLVKGKTFEDIDESIKDWYRKEVEGSTKAEISDRTEKDKLTALLCEACETIISEGINFATHVSPELREWYDEHTRFDRERKAEEDRRERLEEDFAIWRNSGFDPSKKPGF